MIPFFDALQRTLSDEVAQHARDIAFSPASDYGDYRQRAGFIQGLQAAMDLASEVEKKFVTR